MQRSISTATTRSSAPPPAPPAMADTALSGCETVKFVDSEPSNHNYTIVRNASCTVCDFARHFGLPL